MNAIALLLLLLLAGCATSSAGTTHDHSLPCRHWSHEDKQALAVDLGAIDQHSMIGTMALDWSRYRYINCGQEELK